MIRARQSVREIKEYVAGKSVEEVAASYGIDEHSIVKLASNENCLGPSPRAIEAIRESACDVHVYPSVDAIELREAVARRYDIPVGNVVCSAGVGTFKHLLDPEGQPTVPFDPLDVKGTNGAKSFPWGAAGEAAANPGFNLQKQWGGACP